MKKLQGIFIVLTFVLWSQFCQANVLPQTGWKLVSVDSQETVAANCKATNSFDGNALTMWHTQWYPTSTLPPHEIQIDLGQMVNLSGFHYLPRQDGGVNGRIGQYEFYASSDGTNWGSPLASGTFVNDANEKEVLFPVTAGRYIRLRALTEANGGAWTSMAELNVLGDVISSQTPISQAGWSLLYVDSQETVAENGHAINSFDGNPLTMWHTQWYPTSTLPPHEIQIDLGQEFDLKGFRYLPRQDGGVNGRIGQYEFYTSSDGKNWGTPVATGTFANNVLEKEVSFTTILGRYIRLRALTEANGNAWTSMAELNVLGNLPGALPPNGIIDAPVHNIIINAGDSVNFVGSGSDPDGYLPLTYLWHFSTGSGISDKTTQSTGPLLFNSVGTYIATLTVTNSKGIAATTPPTVTITVRQTPIPQAGWKLLYVDSQETVAENGKAVNSFDGNPLTMWHTQWYPTSTLPPHEIQIDLGQMINIAGFRYLPRQDGGVNGRIGLYEFYTSSDGKNWGTPVASGTFANDVTEKEVLLAAAAGRYVRVRALTEANGGAWTSMAELNILGTPVTGVFPPTGIIDSPFSDMVINPGSYVNFAGSGNDSGGYLPLSYLWHFSIGSGISDTALRNPGLLQFQNPGTYTVSLTATNTKGISDALPPTRMITVQSLLPLLPDFYSIVNSPFNLVPAPGVVMPVLSGKDVTDIVSTRGVSDPFLLHDDDGSWHMFLEVMAADYSRIGHATSPDGIHWTYDKIVLDDGYHSYPSVLKYNGNYYMIPESFEWNAVRVYKAASFPYNWQYVKSIVSGKAFVDPQVFRYNNTWWMFVSDTANLNCYLYYSNDLLGTWVEHPMSPIITNDAGKARGGGRAFVTNNGQIYRTVQKDDVIYGEAVRAFVVDILTKTAYAEHEIPESPILKGSGLGWNKDGMHHFDPWWAGDKWIASVDGIVYPVEQNGDGTGEIGIYISQ